MNSFDNEKEEVKFVPNIPKNPQELALQKDKTLTYPNLNLYLGSLAGYVVQGHPDFMPQFVAHLNSLSDNLGTDILAGLKRAREDFENHFRGRQIVWLSEISFSPSLEQINTIIGLLKDCDIVKISRINGFDKPEQLIREVIIGRLLQIRIDEENLCDVFSMIEDGTKMVRRTEKKRPIN